ncbi:hypothetical protein STEG23_027108 [Scotinomys teguina]
MRGPAKVRTQQPADVQTQQPVDVLIQQPAAEAAPLIMRSSRAASSRLTRQRHTAAPYIPPPSFRSTRGWTSPIVIVSPDLMMPPNNSFGETKSTFIKHLAFENANLAFQDVLRPHHDSASLSEYVCLCARVGTAHAMGLAIGVALCTALGLVGDCISQRLCYSYKQPGHFAKQCPPKGPPSSGKP